ncbi:MAG: hypothetical protein FJX59_07455 [Alphaproteobacteria bacterium]|nr:hypothetical protein [Alphaproteobacteria bacterium]
MAAGAPAQPEPALWLNSTNATFQASSITVELVASDYATPLGTFNLLATSSGTVNLGMSYSIDGFFDWTNSGLVGAGVNVLSSAGAGFVSVAANTSTFVTNGGLYSASWTLNVTRTLAVDGNFVTSGIN